MKTYKPFSIIVVPFPFVDSGHIKKRPAVVLSSEEFQKQTKHITLLMVTSVKNNPWLGDHKIIDLDSTGLRVESVIRQKIFTLDSRLIVSSIGKLSTEDKQCVVKLTSKHLNALN